MASCCEIVEPPATTRPLRAVLVHRLLDAVPVEAFVLDELRVLGGDHRALEVDRDALVGNPHVLQARLRVALAQLGEPRRHERRLARRVIAPPPDVERRTRPAAARTPGATASHRPKQPARRACARLSPAQHREHGRGVRAHAAPEREALRRLLDQHAEAVRGSRRALRGRPGGKGVVAFGVDQVVRERTAAQTGRPATDRAGPSLPRPMLVALMTTSKRCPASAAGAIARRPGPSRCKRARPARPRARACDWR